ncbi:FxLYD domain-containing protein (plasmid) [Cupriavidus sp. H19C3]|uniref:FxLYD domain-containing protein n=1 Tax=Cupriavidus sp. H19C3 TaxID=3241603 RepID=UPI003BF90E8D
MKRIIAAMTLIAAAGSAIAAEAVKDLPVAVLAMTSTGPRTVEVQGVLTNTSGKKLSNVVVTIPLYDAGDVRVGQAMAVSMNLRAGEKWSFAAPGAGPAAGSIAKTGVPEVLAISE